MAQQIMRMLFATIALALVVVPGASALEIVYPADGTFVVRNNYIIFRGGEPAIDAFSIEVDGVKSQLLDISSPQYRQLMQDKVILPAGDPAAPLYSEAGKHKLVVEGYVRGQAEWEKVSTAQAEFYYSTDPTEPPPRGFKPFVMHDPENEAGCASCHDMNPDRVAMSLDTVQTNPCGKCHKRMLAKKHVHGPAGVLECGGCHDADTRPSKYQVTMPDLQMCNECHEDKNAEFNQNKYVHGPVGAGLCLICHDAHASDQVAQLVAPVNELCLGCHSTVVTDTHVVRGVGGEGHPLKGRPDPSRPGRELSCASCHDPHGGASRHLFRGGITGRFGLCQFCHQK